MQRVGVFICHCGTNIAASIDCAQVAANVQNYPGVAYSTDYKYMCSEPGQEMIKEAIKAHQLDRVVVGLHVHPECTNPLSGDASVTLDSTPIFWKWPISVSSAPGCIPMTGSGQPLRQQIWSKWPLPRSATMRPCKKSSALSPSGRWSWAAVLPAFRQRWILPTMAIR